MSRKNETIRIHVTADERYDLFLNGERIGSGPEKPAYRNNPAY